MHAWESFPFKPFCALEELSNDVWSSPFHEIFGTLRKPNAWRSWQCLYKSKAVATSAPLFTVNSVGRCG